MPKKDESTKEESVDEVKTKKGVKKTNSKENNDNNFFIKIKTKINEIFEKVKTKTKEGKSISLIITTIIALCVIAFIIFLLFFRNKTLDYPVMFVENDQLVFWDPETEEKVVVDEMDYDGTYYLNYRYPNTTTDLMLYNYYNLEEDNLYLYNSSTLEIIKVGTDIDSYAFSANDKYVIYENTDSIYVYEIKNNAKTKIDSAEDDEFLSFIVTENNYLIYAIEDDTDDTYTVYSYKIGKDDDAEMIDTNVAYFKEAEDGMIFYTKYDDGITNVYSYNTSEKKSSKIVTDISYISDYTDDYSEFIYLKLAENAPVILVDDELDNDPVEEVEVERECTFSDYYYYDYCTRDEYYDDKIITVVEEIDKKEVNDEIRTEAESIVFYDVYYYDGSESILMQENVTSVIASNEEEEIIVYGAYDADASVEISSLTTLDEFTAFLEENYSINYKVEDDNSIEIDTDEEISYGKIADDEYAYLKNADGEIYYIDLSKSETKLNLLTEDGGTSYIFDGQYYYENGDDLYIAEGNKTSLIIEDVYSTSEFDDYLYILHDCNEDNDSCDYSKYKDKLEFIETDVYGSSIIDENTIYIYKNYNSTNYLVDVYFYKNGESNLVAYDLKTSYISSRYINY